PNRELPEKWAPHRQRPEAVDETVAVESIPQGMRMEALQQYGSVMHRVAEEQPHLAAGERLELFDERFAVFRHERVKTAKARLERSGELRCRDLTTGDPCAILADGDLQPAALHPHRVQAAVGRG